MQELAKNIFMQDSWQTPRNARTLAAYMALKNREIGDRLASLRASRGNPPQEVVAQKLDVSVRSYQAWEAGDTKPSWRNLTRLAKHFGVTEEFILLGDPAELVKEEEPEPMAQGQLDEVVARLERIEEIVEGIRDLNLSGFGAIESLLREQQTDEVQRRRRQG